MPRQAALAWAIHGYTATGLVLAAGMAFLIVRAGPGDLHLALALMWLAAAVDATDGWLARRAHVGEALPSFDGRRLDDIVDFHTYTSLPLLLIWRAELLPGALGWLLVLPLLASAYGFSQTDAKTPDGYFKGFPSYWNVVAFYLFFLAPAAWVTVVVLAVLSVLTFVPALYLYPSRGTAWWRTTTALGAVWGLILLAVLAGIPARPEPWLLASLLFPAYYLVLSWWITLQRWRRVRAAR